MAAYNNLRDFLTEYFKLERMKDMRDNHTEQWAHFEDVVTSGDMTKDMKKWADTLLQKNSAGFVRVPAGGEYQIKDVNDKLSDVDWETLFLICQNVYAQLYKDRSSYIGNAPVIEFINDWDHLFTGTETASVVATQKTKDQCDDLKNLLKTYKHFLQPKLENPSDKHLSGILDSNMSYDQLISGLEKGKYDKDDSFREKIQDLASKIHNACNDKQFLNNIGGKKPELSLIYDIYAPGWTRPDLDTTRLKLFKQQYSNMFNKLYKNNKVLEAFKSKEGNDNRISAAIEAAKKGIDYDDTNSKNYLAPKRDDALTPMQQVQKWASDKYEDCLEKYLKLKGDRLFFSDQAKAIVKALDKAGVKPTDGIKGLCDGDKIAKVVSALKKSVKASDHFDWMSKTLKSFVDDPNMKRTVAGALKNGRQMRNLVSELIMKAVEDSTKDSKVENEEVIAKAKTAMEVLSVMKYGATTSKVMDAFGKEELSVFSNGNLSWNKNEGVQFVTKALDKSIKFAFKTVGYGMTIINNQRRLYGSKFDKEFQHGKNDKTGARLRAASLAHDTLEQSEKQQFKRDKAAFNRADNAKLRTKRADRADALNDLFGANAPKRVTEATARRVDAEEKKIYSDPALSEAYAEYQPLQEQLDTYEQVKSLLDQKEIYEQELADLNTALGSAATNSAQQEAIKEEIKLVAADMRKIKQNIADYEGIYPGLTGLDRMTSVQLQTNVIDGFVQSGSKYDVARNKYETTSNEINQKKQAVKKFRDAQTEVKNLSDAIDKRKEQEQKWDKSHRNVYQELVAYWDMLESGRDSHTGKMYGKLAGFALGSKKAKQKAFDAQKQSIIDSYWTVGNTYAA